MASVFLEELDLKLGKESAIHLAKNRTKHIQLLILEDEGLVLQKILKS